MNEHSLTINYLEWWFGYIGNTKGLKRIWSILWTTTLSLIMVPLCVIIDIPWLVLCMACEGGS